MTDLTEAQVLGVLGRIQADLDAQDQMRLALKQVGVVIQRYRDIAPKLGELAKEEIRLKDTVAGLEADIETRRRAGAAKIQSEHDRLRQEMQTALAPLAEELSAAQARVSEAETRAVAIEEDCALRTQSATSAAEAAESRLASAEKHLEELGNLTRR